MKKRFWVLPLLILLAFAVVFLIATSNGKSDYVKFIESYGWEVEDTPIEIESFKLPDTLDTVYMVYNDIQLRAHFDLTTYMGKEVTRYTYKVLNYVDGARCNILVYDGKIIAADISTVAIDGFMHAINERLY